MNSNVLRVRCRRACRAYPCPRFGAGHAADARRATLTLRSYVHHPKAGLSPSGHGVQVLVVGCQTLTEKIREKQRESSCSSLVPPASGTERLLRERGFCAKVFNTTRARVRFVDFREHAQRIALRIPRPSFSIFFPSRCSMRLVPSFSHPVATLVHLVSPSSHPVATLFYCISYPHFLTPCTSNGSPPRSHDMTRER